MLGRPFKAGHVILRFMDTEKIFSKLEKIPALKILGIEPISWRKGEVSLRLPFNPGLCNSLGTVQGGFITALADAAGGWALISFLPRNHIVPTVEIKINFLQPVRSDVVATGKVIHKSKRLGTAFIEVSFENSGELAAVAVGTYRIISLDTQKLP